jgi:hypothetical protein
MRWWQYTRWRWMLIKVRQRILLVLLEWFSNLVRYLRPFSPHNDITVVLSDCRLIWQYLWSHKPTGSWNWLNELWWLLLLWCRHVSGDWASKWANMYLAEETLCHLFEGARYNKGESIDQLTPRSLLQISNKEPIREPDWLRGTLWNRYIRLDSTWSINTEFNWFSTLQQWLAFLDSIPLHREISRCCESSCRSKSDRYPHFLRCLWEKPWCP